MLEKIAATLDAANHIVVIQADNPDADSIGSALALEEILSEQGKQVSLYCGVQMPEYLRYLEGWDRVSPELPRQFDASIVVDASTYTLLDKLSETSEFALVKSKPCIVLDHHATVENPLDFTDLKIVEGDLSSTGELIFSLSTSLGWSITPRAADYIMAAVLGDTQGLMNELTTAATYRLMADLTDMGANRPKLEELRREYSKMPEVIYKYKGMLIGKTEFAVDGKVALVHVPQEEINTYSPLYNPAPLIQFDTLQVKGVVLSIVLKSYDDGRVTGSLRSNSGYPISGELAKQMGGGGHDYASGFKATNTSYVEIKKRCLEVATSLITHGDIA